MAGLTENCSDDNMGYRFVDISTEIHFYSKK